MDAPLLNLGSPQNALTAGVVELEYVKVCKLYVGSAGPAVTINVSAVDNSDPNNTGSTSVTLNDGECRKVWVVGGTGATVTLTEVSLGSSYTTTWKRWDDNGDDLSSTPDAQGSGNSAVAVAGGGAQLKGALIQFVNTFVPQGKTFGIGPSSMEGAIKITSGDWVNGGYSFKFVSGSHTATTFTVTATVTITGPCSNGGTDVVTIPLGTVSYAVPAGNTSWLPTGDQNSVLSWQGSMIANVCGGVGTLNASKGAVFTATVSQNPPSGSLVDFRFKYRDAAAKGKPNTNCLDTSDPNRAKADVCGASWSQTVRDP